MSSGVHLFTVDLGIDLALDAWLVSAPGLWWILSKRSPIRIVFGSLAKTAIAKGIEFGVIKFDVSMDSLKAAMQKPEYVERAHKLYAKAQLKAKYAEDQKEAIRREYFALLELAASGL